MSSDIREILAAEATLRLPDGIAVVDVADACRHATSEFLSAIDEKAALAAWLVGPYRELTSFVATPSRQERIATPVRAEQVRELYAYARAYVLGIVRGLGKEDGDHAFTLAAIRDGWIEKCRDEHGHVGWVPVDRPKMRLTERVLSLVAVDYLVRPADWLGGPCPVLLGSVSAIAV